MKKLFSLLCIYSVAIVVAAHIYASGVSCHFILILRVFQNLLAENVKFKAHPSVYLSEREWNDNNSFNFV